jgi:2,3-bisphosphoglycerate-dependent phosphoglycerate mutase
MNSIERPEELILIRHAESARNAAKKGSVYFTDDEARKTVRGIPDYKVPITDFGGDQAEKTGVYLRRQFGAPDYFYHSGYLRTIQTLERILGVFSVEERVKIEIRMNQFVRERDSGYAYDMTTAEAEAAFPWLKEHWQTFGGFFARPPGGESISDLTQRVYAFLNTIFRDRVGQKVWVVTHGVTLRAFRFILERWTYDQALSWPEGQSPENCGITRYKYDAEQQRLVLQEYNTVGWR